MFSRGPSSSSFWLRILLAFSFVLCALSPAVAQNVCYNDASDDGGRHTQRAEATDRTLQVARHADQDGRVAMLTGRFTPAGYSLAAHPEASSIKLPQGATRTFSKLAQALGNRAFKPDTPPPLI